MTDLYTRFVADYLFPVQERLKGHTSIARLEALEQSQWCSHQQIRQIQADKLGRFIQQIYRDVPYYTQLLDQHGIAPGSIDRPEALQGLPLLTKALIREHSTNLKAVGAEGLKPFNTGGSSGAPLIFYLNAERVSHDVAAKRRATRWWGVDIGDREVVAWGSPIELNSQDRLRALRDRLMRTELIPAFNLGESQIAAFIRRIRRFKPVMLFGYPSVYALIAQYAESTGIQLDDIGIKVAFVTSERLYDHQRKQIEKVFACPVANGYGGRDAGFIAHECPVGGMHISAEDIIVEILDPSGVPLPEGESGEIVVTHLATGAFPFVRYRTGDVGAISTTPCACGRGLPLLKSIEGRSTDFVVAKDGTVMHGLALIYILREIPSVKEFKVTQHSLELTEVELVLQQGPLTKELVRQITDKMQQRLGADVSIRVTEVERIAPEKSGKYRYIKSLVDVTAL